MGELWSRGNAERCAHPYIVLRDEPRGSPKPGLEVNEVRLHAPPSLRRLERSIRSVVAGLAVSVMANFAGNITNPVVEDPFKPQIWQP